MSEEEDTRRLMQAIVHFLDNQLITRDFSTEDTNELLIAVETIENAYGIENYENQPRRSLLDMFTQATNPVSVKDKQEAESLKTEGNQKMHEECYTEADDYYTRAIELDKWNPIYYCNRAAARIKLRRFFDAVNDCRQALTLSPDYAKAHDRMGQAYVAMDRHDIAVLCFRQAVRHDPDNERYKNNFTVAQTQSDEATAEDVGTFLQNFLGSLMGGGPLDVPLGIPPSTLSSDTNSSSDADMSSSDSSSSISDSVLATLNQNRENREEVENQEKNEAENKSN